MKLSICIFYLLDSCIRGKSFSLRFVKHVSLFNTYHNNIDSNHVTFRKKDRAVLKSIVGTTTFGNFDDGIYNPLRNTYFWEDNLNIMPLSRENAKLISSGWRMSQIPNDFSEDPEYSLFYHNLQKSKGLVYKWVPSFDKNIIKGLIYTNIDQDKKIIYIIQILPNPNIEMFNIDFLIEDLEQLRLTNKKYFKFKIDYRYLNTN